MEFVKKKTLELWEKTSLRFLSRYFWPELSRYELITLSQLEGSLNANSDKKVKPTKPNDNVDSAKFMAGVIKLISDDKSLLIFCTIFLASGDSSETIRAELKLTRKQYYSRISRLIKNGLVKRQKGRYFLTAFGKVIYDSQKLLGTAIKNYWKLKAIDSLGVANDNKMPKEERKRIIEELIGNQQIKDILLST
jgi:DNA-binding HxlR family transcriptional regulator